MDRVRGELFPFFGRQMHIGWRYLFVAVRCIDNVVIHVFSSLSYSLSVRRTVANFPMLLSWVIYLF